MKGDLGGDDVEKMLNKGRGPITEHLGSSVWVQTHQSSKEWARGQGSGPDEESCPRLFTEMETESRTPTPITHVPWGKDSLSRAQSVEHSFKTYPHTKGNVTKRIWPCTISCLRMIAHPSDPEGNTLFSLADGEPTRGEDKSLINDDDEQQTHLQRGPQAMHCFLQILNSSNALPKLCMCMRACSVAKLCPTLYKPLDCSPPTSSLLGIFQAKILEWVAISSSRGSSQHRDWTSMSCIGRQITHYHTTWEAPA